MPKEDAERKKYVAIASKQIWILHDTKNFFLHYVYTRISIVVPKIVECNGVLLKHKTYSAMYTELDAWDILYCMSSYTVCFFGFHQLNFVILK